MSESITCPACGGVNPGDAVFCANPECHKALGDFKYVLEEIRAASTWVTRLADRITSFTGQPHFVAIHLMWFGLWIFLNSGIIAAVQMFDPYPYGLLGIILAIEAILITSFLLISNNRQNAHTEKMAELEYDVNVRSYRQIGALRTELKEFSARLQALEQRLK